MSASPESFRGKLKEAWECYRVAYEATRTSDDEEFTRLVRWSSIISAIEDLSRMQGILQTKMSELKKDSPRKQKYKKIYDRMSDLIDDLKTRL